jgi:putative flippase GtrA
MNIATTMKTTNAKELMKMISTGALTTIRDLLVALLAGAVVAGLAAVASG